MKTYFSLFFSSCFLLIFLPFLCTFFLHGTQACIFLQKFDCEDFLPYLLSLQIDQNQEPEALKSQAVLARTNFIYQESQGESSQEILENTFSEIFDTASWLRLLFLPDQYYDAVEKTKNQILTFQETPCLVPYHRSNCGKTRDGEEVFHNSSYSYLQSVDSSWDLDAPDYLTEKTFSKEQLPESLEIQQVDSAGYVLSLKADTTSLSGESFRFDMNLPSSCFSIQLQGNSIKIICKGQGHGLGLSQYGADAMAKEGNTFDEILTWYFPKLTLSSSRS